MSDFGFLTASAPNGGAIVPGVTPIIGGVVGRVLFEGAGNVVQESANLFWDNTNGRLGIGGTPGAFNLDVVGSARTLGTSQIRSSSGSVLGSNLTTTAAAIFYNNGFSGVVGVGSYANSGGEIQSAQNGGLSVGGFLTLQRQGGNVLIGTATDAGYRLDVNGTARVQGSLSLTAGNAINIGNLQALAPNTGNDLMVGFNNSLLTFYTGNNPVGRFFSTGNFAINTITDAGFRLDVNGTARVSGAATLAGTNTLSGTTNVSGLSSNWICQYPSNATVKPLSFSAQSGGATSNNVAIQFGFNFRESGGLFTQDIFQNILYDNTTNNVVTGFEWYTHQTQAGSNPSVLAMALRGKTLSIGTNTPNASAVLQADSTTQGFLPPRMTTAQKNAIATPATGLQVYDTTLNQMSYYNGTTWTNI